MAVEALTEEVIRHALSHFEGWVYKDHKIQKTFHYETYAECLAFVNVVGALAERQAHHPDIGLSYGKVVLSYSTHDAGHRVSKKDLEAAEAVEAFERL